jgi:DNA-binding protein YbaB
MLSDMIIAAVNEAIKKANTEKETVMQNISGQMNLPGLF